MKVKNKFSKILFAINQTIQVISFNTGLCGLIALLIYSITHNNRCIPWSAYLLIAAAALYTLHVLINVIGYCFLNFDKQATVLAKAAESFTKNKIKNTLISFANEIDNAGSIDRQSVRKEVKEWIIINKKQFSQEDREIALSLFGYMISRNDFE